MNLYFRFIFLLIKSFLNPQKQDLFDPCETQFKVNLMDLDLNFHMNNGRFLSLMDLGRIDLMIKSQVFKKLITQGYYPVIVSESIRFKKSLELFQNFSIISQLDSWDEKDFYINQRFIVNHNGGTDLVAEGYIKGRFKQRKRQGSVPTSEIFMKAGYELPVKPKTPLAEAQDQIESRLCSVSK